VHVVYRVPGTEPPQTIAYVPPACRLYDEVRRAGLEPKARKELRRLRDEAEAEARRWGIWGKAVDFEWYWEEYERFVRSVEVPALGRC
jgi:hypothetical protein